MREYYSIKNVGPHGKPYAARNLKTREKGFMIRLRIHEESDLYNSFDPEQIKISESVYSYLKSCCTESEMEKNMHDTLQIVCDGPIDAARFQGILSETTRNDQAEYDRQISFYHKRAIGGYALGFLFSALGVGLAVVFDQVLLAIISFLGTSAFSEAFSIHARKVPELKKEKKLLDPFLEMKTEVIQQKSE